MTTIAAALASLGLDPPAPMPRPVLAARAAIEEAFRNVLAISDEALTRPWRWRGVDGEADVRYGLYRLYERLEEAAAGPAPTQAAGGRILAQANAARWALHGLLLPLSDAEIDRDPGDGEWSVRQTLAHVVMVQWSYSLNTAYWARRGRAAVDLPFDPPREGMPDRDDPAVVAGQASGTLAEVRARLDELFDLAVGLMAGTDDERELEAPALWSGYDVTPRFRLHRFAAHLREHTIQIEKTLAALGRQPREVERIAREIAAAYGRLEGQTYGCSHARAGAALEEAAAEVRRLSTGIRAAAG